MSKSYVYSGDSSYQPGPYAINYTPGTPYSPFIPAALPFQPSPFAQPAFLPTSPHQPSTPLPTAPPAADPSVFYRQRRPSWHGPNPQFSPGGLFPPQRHNRSLSFGQHEAPAPFVPPSPPAVGFVPLTPPSAYPTFLPAMVTPVWAATPLPAWGQSQPSAGPEPRQTIHPLLNGENPQPDFFFNLANSAFAPCRVVGRNGETMPLSSEELSQPATHPPIYDLKVTSDKLPSKWAIEMAYQPPQQNPYYAAANPGNSPNAARPPITVGDVLLQIHRALHLMIERPEWNNLDTEAEGKVTKAFFKRCGAMPAQRDWLVSQGVKRVDFLQEKVIFRGLVRTGTSFKELKLVTSKT